MEELSTRDRRLARKKKLAEIKARKHAESIDSIRLHFEKLFEDYKKEFEEKEHRHRHRAFGLTGQRGESAYEIAVRLGFVGDEASWLLSLIGESGLSPLIDGCHAEDTQIITIDGGISTTDYGALELINGGSAE